jgi:diguanylate cyclase (GGDEF)-like protein
VLYISRKDRLRFAPNYVAVSVTLLFAIFNLAFNTDQASTYIWAIVTPIMSFVMLNVVLGVVISGVLFAYTVTIFLVKYNISPQSVIGVDLFSQFVVVYLFSLILLSVHEVRERKDELSLKEEAYFDYLTGLLNRRGILNELVKQMNYAIRYDVPLSVVLIDIDNFKRINDEFGHDVGDYVLQSFSENLKNNIRSFDFIGRYGGEEFLLVSSGINLDSAIQFAEKLRKLISDDNYVTGSRITASFGVAEYMKGDDTNSLLKRADLAMYDAKTVKDKICFQK